ncbi:hypothetical protein [Oceanicoccus sp. KOV_DT_Chl]|uniref:hypothetical protein n=1 Tax=Oceanicoccus sp. KOV_DT_Chl TaxID=1904639 RepID=UPI00190EA237|nr:hypothetical protein [Oceanicoccus sp. KOV_DT_Chl]
MVELIKVAVAEHEQVISGLDVPFEERPDCEIDSFGDSGINMFVEFWMYGVDDGKNRVGGDLMLIILETLRENGIEIPFPQREVKILNPEQDTAKIANKLLAICFLLLLSSNSIVDAMPILRVLYASL